MDETPEIPEELRARYQLQRRLGKGGFGEVLLVMDRDLDRPVALKLLTVPGDDPVVRGRFEREARRTAEVRHEGVVQVYDHGISTGGIPYILFEFIEGEDLQARLKRSGKLSDGDLLRVGGAVAEALQAIHDTGVVHRDVKPENVLLRGDGQPVLCDLGIARVPEGSTVRTAQGLILGTPPFLAPEVWRGSEPGPEADQFAWAASLFKLRYGRSVYGSEEPGVIIAKVASKAPFRVELPGGARLDPIARVLLRALEEDPGRRFATMKRFAEALRAADSRIRGTGAFSRLSQSFVRSARKGFVPWLSIGIALMVFSALLPGGREAAPEPPPPPQPEEQQGLSVTERLDRIREAMAPVQELHDPEGWEDFGDRSRQDWTRARLEHYLGDELYLRWDSFLRVLARELPALPADPEVQPEIRVALGLRVMPYVLYMHSLLMNIEEFPEQLVAGYMLDHMLRDGEDAGRVAARLRENRERLVDRTRAVLGQIETRSPAAARVIEGLQLTTLVLARIRRGLTPMLERVQEGLRRSEDRATRLNLANALLMAVPWAEWQPKAERCRRKYRLFEETLLVIEEAAENPVYQRRAAVLSTLQLWQVMRTVDICSPDGGEQTERLLSRGVAVLGAHPDVARPLVDAEMRTLSGFFQRGGDIMEASPAVKRWSGELTRRFGPWPTEDGLIGRRAVSPRR